MDISTIQNKLIGVLFMSDPVRKGVTEAWENRFFHEDAFLIQAEPKDDIRTLLRKIFEQMSNENFETMTGVRFVSVFFYDLQDSEMTAAIDKLDIRQLHRELCTAIGCSVAASMQFGYLGKMPFLDSASLRSCAKNILDKQSERLCLVAEGPLEKDGRAAWKAVAVFLDLMRRRPDPGMLIPDSNHRVGFLRYAEYDHEERTDIQEQLEKINSRLNDSGDLSLRQSIEMAVLRIAEDVKKRFTPDPRAVPLLPDLYPEGWIEKTKAQRGISRKYNDARNNVIDALDQTGSHLIDQIRDAYRMDRETAKKELVHLIEEAQAGIPLVLEEGNMSKLIRMDLPVQSRPMLFDLNYDTKEKHLEQIGNYLTQALNRGIYLAQADRLDALWAAYPEVKKLYEDKNNELVQEKNTLQHTLSILMDRPEFLAMAIGNGTKMKSCFHPVVAKGNTARFVLLRQKSDLETVSISEQERYFLNEKTGGLKIRDSFEIKAIQAPFFEYHDNTLPDLIP